MSGANADSQATVKHSNMEKDGRGDDVKQSPPARSDSVATSPSRRSTRQNPNEDDEKADDNDAQIIELDKVYDADADVTPEASLFKKVIESVYKGYNAVQNLHKSLIEYLLFTTDDNEPGNIRSIGYTPEWTQPLGHYTVIPLFYVRHLATSQSLLQMAERTMPHNCPELKLNRKPIKHKFRFYLCHVYEGMGYETGTDKAFLKKEKKMLLEFFKSNFQRPQQSDITSIENSLNR